MIARLLPRLASMTAAVIIASALTACGGGGDSSGGSGTVSKPVFEPGTGGTVSSAPLFASYAAADALLRNLGYFPDLKKPILVASLVNINDMEASSGFGRMTSEQIASRLANSGLPVAEIKLRESILVEEGKGELMLSRDARNIARSRGAQAVVVGTYATGSEAVFVNVRMISAMDGRILSSHDYVVPMTADVAALLNSDLQTLLGIAGPNTVAY